MIRPHPVARALRNVAIALLAAFALALSHGAARAAPDADQPRQPSGQSEAPGDEALAEAKRLFHEANGLRKAGDYEGALSLYQQSRAVVPSVPNTLNAAICLVELQRHDEALDLYQELLRSFGDELSPTQRRDIGRRVAAERQKVGSIDVRANAGGTVLIDGRLRGELPFRAPVHVLPGRHVVRISGKGLEDFETAIRVEARETKIVEAQLRPLGSRGYLRIDPPKALGAEVRVDGAPVGTVPWNGSVAPGPHTVTIDGGEKGAGPIRVVAVGGETVAIRPEILPLGPVVRLRALPSTSTLSIDGVRVGEGFWEGRLPTGEHQITACDEGYHCAERTVAGHGDRPRGIELELEADHSHPRWQREQETTYWLDLFGGIAIAPSLGSSAEATCDGAAASAGCGSISTPLGAMVGLRGGIELWAGLSVVLSAGYLHESQSISRAEQESFLDTTGATVATRYELDDELIVHGPYLGVGASYRQPMLDWLELKAELLIGVHFAFSSDTITGEATDGTHRVAAEAEGSAASAFAANLMVLPGLQINGVFSDFHAGLGLLVPIMALEGPPLELGDVTVDDATCQQTGPGAVACAPGEALVAEDRAYDTHVVLVPYVTLGYRF